MNKSTLYDDIYSGTNIVSGEEYREMITTIAQLASDVVVKTLGPYGSTTIIDDGSGFTYPSKDGWTALNKLRFNDPMYNTIFGLLKQISFNSVNTVGDGTTTAMVGANYFLDAINKMPKESGFRQAEFIKVIDEVADMIIEQIMNSGNVKYVSEDNNYEDIYKIAKVATNGNESFASIIRNIYLETSNPNIHVQLSKSPTTSYEIEEGYKFDCHTLNFPTYINEDNGTCRKSTLTNCIIFDHNITYNEHKVIISALSQLASTRNTDVIIMAPYFDDIISTMIDSSVQQMVQRGQIPNIILMQIPISMDIHKKVLQDLSLLINAPIFDTGRLRAFNILHHNQTHSEEEQIEDDIFEIEQYNFESPQDILVSSIGNIRTIVIDKSHAFIQNYDSIVNKTKYDAVIKEVTEEYETLKKKAAKTLNGHLDKDFMNVHMRYTKLLGKTGVIYVGGLSDLQKRCDKDSIDDAVLVCKSAYENGYIRGMNLETLNATSKVLDSIGIATKSYHTRAAVMLYQTFYKVTMAVLKNKYEDDHDHIFNGPDGEIKGLDRLIKYCLDNDCGFDLVNESFSSMDDLVVINSVSTDIEILKAIVNILTTIMTSNQFLSTNKSYDRKISHAQQLQRAIDDKVAITSAAMDTILNKIKEDKDILELINRIIMHEPNDVVYDKNSIFYPETTLYGNDDFTDDDFNEDEYIENLCIIRDNLDDINDTDTIYNILEEIDYMQDMISTSNLAILDDLAGKLKDKLDNHKDNSTDRVLRVVTNISDTSEIED